ncbi:MAG: oligosaccharide flippase family protein, partial [Herbiconiux sp.]|nr:oligosaccharide flippase family protein [Herbiconiux sp.]
WALEALGLGAAWRGVPFAPVWVAALVFLTATFTALTQAALRERKYGLVAKRAPIQSIGTAAGQVALGFLTPTPVGLLGGLVAGRFAGFLPLVRQSRTLIAQTGTPARAALREYWRLPTILAPSALLNSLGSQIPLLFVAAFFGSHAAGEFGMAQRLVYIPVTLVGAAVAQVFAAELAKHVREGGSGGVGVYWRTSMHLSLLAVPTSLAVALLGPWALPYVLGEQWVLAGDLCVPLALLVGLSLVVMPTSQVYTIFQSPASLVMDVSRILLLGSSVAVVISADLPLIEACWLLTAAQGINYLATWAYGIQLTRKATP